VRHNGLRVALITLLLSAIWFVLSGRLDVLHFGTGVIVALALAINARPMEDATRFRPLRFAAYVPWLVVQIVRSNWRVARSVLRRDMRISPAFITQRPDVVGDRALATLGASITLTPGTLTLDVTSRELFVHALDTSSADDVHEGIIAARVARVFEASS
jgi:multicomponent Na+:H+ antiporter subunit E